VSAYSAFDFGKEDGLSRSDVHASGHVTIGRYGDSDVDYQPSSVDVHLGDEFLMQNEQKTPVFLDDEDTYPEYQTRYTEEFMLHPGQFVLATTEECISLDNEVVGYLWGRSSVGRLGVFVHNAGLVDAGYEGDITLELLNVSPNTIALQSGMSIAQLTVHELRTPTSNDYETKGGKYQSQSGVTPSRLYEEFEGDAE